MGTHPIFESDFDCLTERDRLTQIDAKSYSKMNLFFIILLLCEKISGNAISLQNDQILSREERFLAGILGATNYTDENHISSSLSRRKRIFGIGTDAAQTALMAGQTVIMGVQTAIMAADAANSMFQTSIMYDELVQSREANRLAGKANRLSGEANRLSGEANSLSGLANQISLEQMSQDMVLTFMQMQQERDLDEGDEKLRRELNSNLLGELNRIANSIKGVEIAIRQRHYQVEIDYTELIAVPLLKNWLQGYDYKSDLAISVEQMEMFVKNGEFSRSKFLIHSQKVINAFENKQIDYTKIKNQGFLIDIMFSVLKKCNVKDSVTSKYFDQKRLQFEYAFMKFLNKGAYYLDGTCNYESQQVCFSSYFASQPTRCTTAEMDPNKKIYNRICRNAVLVLSTNRPSNRPANRPSSKPFIADFDGNINEDLNFEYGSGTSAVYGCGATLHNIFWYFGGTSLNSRQVSKVVGCKLERQDNLDFDFYLGSCNTFNQPDQKVLLCFDYRNAKQCHTFDGQSYQSAGSSVYSHSYTTTRLANYLGKALITGCGSRSSCGVKTELMDMETLTWSAGPDYPSQWTPSHAYIFRYSTASTSEAAFIIGGYYTQNIIAEFRGGSWRQMGTLAKGRYAHGSITFNGETMVIGGYTTGSDAETKIWDFIDESNQVVGPTLPDGDYAWGIGL